MKASLVYVVEDDIPGAQLPRSTQSNVVFHSWSVGYYVEQLLQLEESSSYSDKVRKLLHWFLA